MVLESPSNVGPTSPDARWSWLIGILIAVVVLWFSYTYGSAYTHGYIDGCSKHNADGGSIIHVGVWGGHYDEGWAYGNARRQLGGCELG